MVSAIIGQTSAMQKFAKAWQKDLDENHVDFFHATEHWNKRAKPYHGLSMTTRSDLLSRLVKHIDKYVEVGISVAVDAKEYESITSPRFRSNWGAPFAIAIQYMMMLIHVDLKNRGRDHEYANILIEQGTHIHQALEIIDKSRNSGHGFVKVASVGHGPKAYNPILQAADLLAYAWGENLSTGKSRMLTDVAMKRPDRFPCLPINDKLVKDLKQDIDADIKKRRNMKNAQRLDAGLKPFLKTPDTTTGP
ncbi:MAG: DUF3800 domain-containing protein [Candidatus Micrarchaeaceae archaeon]